MFKTINLVHKFSPVGCHAILPRPFPNAILPHHFYMSRVIRVISVNGKRFIRPDKSTSRVYFTSPQIIIRVPAIFWGSISLLIRSKCWFASQPLAQTSARTPGKRTHYAFHTVSRSRIRIEFAVEYYIREERR